jgi:L-ascorbate metabolism protein UlaG (beta-lactamase superfamily)
MKLQLVRSATLRVEVAHRRFIIDPYLAARHSRPSFSGKSPNPLVDLPFSPQDAVAGIEMALISHLHSDHFDSAAQELLSKDTPILCQSGDEGQIASKGFRQVTPVSDRLSWHGITITRTPCQHGSGAVLAEMGRASGFIIQADGEPTVYWTGDTIWNDSVADIVATARPQIIVTHSCGAVWGDGILIVMDAAQTIEVCRAAPSSVVVATHMDSLDHATVSRAELRHFAEAQGIRREQLLIPADGETLAF